MRWLVLSLAITWALAAAAAQIELPKQLAAIKGKTVPDFVLRDLDGKQHRFAQFRGKVVLMNFWSPY